MEHVMVNGGVILPQGCTAITTVTGSRSKPLSATEVRLGALSDWFGLGYFGVGRRTLRGESAGAEEPRSGTRGHRVLSEPETEFPAATDSAEAAKRSSRSGLQARPVRRARIFNEL